MNILFLNHNVAFSGGTFFRAFHIARALQQRGHHCTVLTISKNNRARPVETARDGVRLVQTPDLLPGIGRTGWDPWDTLWRMGWLWRHRHEFDLIHAFDSRPVVILPALFLKQVARLPLVLDWCDWWGRGGLIEERGYGLVDRLMRPLETWFEEHFRTRATATTVISNRLRKRAEELGVPSATIMLLPQGCNPAKFSPLPISAARQQLGLAPDDYIAGYLGKLLATDQPFLAEVTRQVHARLPHFKVVHIGPPGSCVPTDLIAEGSYIQAGRVSDEALNLYMNACDAFLLPLRDTLANNARWPSKVNDYLAAGRPVVATRVSDVAGYFDRCNFGLLAEPNVADFAAQVVKLYQQDHLEEMGSQARQLAATELSWESLVSGLERFYDQVQAGGFRKDRIIEAPAAALK